MSSGRTVYDTSRGDSPAPEVSVECNFDCSYTAKPRQATHGRENLTKNELMHLLDRQEKVFNLLLEQRLQAPSSSQKKMIKIKDPRSFCGGAKELHIFISHLRENYHIHSHLFPDDTTK